MLSNLLFYLGGIIPLVMGIIHLFPTKSVVDGFGNISIDNKLIITMEWIVEGVTLIFIGTIIIGVTKLGASNNVGIFIYMSSIIVLIVLSIISFLTGGKVKRMPVKICPFMYILSAVLLVLAIVS